MNCCFCISWICAHVQVRFWVFSLWIISSITKLHGCSGTGQSEMSPINGVMWGIQMWTAPADTQVDVIMDRLKITYYYSSKWTRLAQRHNHSKKMSWFSFRKCEYLYSNSTRINNTGKEEVSERRCVWAPNGSDDGKCVLHTIFSQIEQNCVQHFFFLNCVGRQEKKD